MRKIQGVLAFALILSLLAIGTAMAVPPGQTVEFVGGAMGKVTFSGQFHASKGKVCADCHTGIFQYKKGTAQITYDSHTKMDAFCFKCHNGTVAYAPTGNCGRCHKK